MCSMLDISQKVAFLPKKTDLIQNLALSKTCNLKKRPPSSRTNWKCLDSRKKLRTPPMGMQKYQKQLTQREKKEREKCRLLSYATKRCWNPRVTSIGHGIAHGKYELHHKSRCFEGEENVRNPYRYINNNSCNIAFS